MKYEAISQYSSEFKVARMCESFKIRQSGYYQWKKGVCRRQHKRREEIGTIMKVEEEFKDSRKTYGYRRMARSLQAKGICISEYRVMMIMRETGLYPLTQRRMRPYPKQKSDGRYSENTLNREFQVSGPDKVWAGDITYIKTRLGWVYLSVVLDLYNREVLGYSVSKKIDTELVKRSLCNALAGRKSAGELLFHSDRGTQDSSFGFGEILEKNNIRSSMSRSGCPYDNSCVESFFATTKKECIHRRDYSTMEEIEQDIFEYIQIFYNRKRIHSTLGYLSPVEYRMRREGAKIA